MSASPPIAEVETIDALIRAEIEPMINAKKWAEAERREKRHRKELHRLIKAS